MAKKRNRVRFRGTFVAVLPSADNSTGVTVETGETMDVVPDSYAEPELPGMSTVGAADSAQAALNPPAVKSLNFDGATTVPRPGGANEATNPISASGDTETSGSPDTSGDKLSRVCHVLRIKQLSIEMD